MVDGDREWLKLLLRTKNVCDITAWIVENPRRMYAARSEGDSLSSSEAAPATRLRVFRRIRLGASVSDTTQALPRGELIP